MTIRSRMEQSLCVSYRAQLTHYREALELAEGLVGRGRAGEDISTSVARLTTLLDQVARHERELSTSRAKEIQDTVSTSPELTELLTELTPLVERLTQYLAVVEEQVTARHQELVLQLDTLIRGQEMRKAYGPSPTRHPS